jgi:hypothetical protein
MVRERLRQLSRALHSSFRGLAFGLLTAAFEPGLELAGAHGVLWRTWLIAGSCIRLRRAPLCARRNFARYVVLTEAACFEAVDYRRRCPGRGSAAIGLFQAQPRSRIWAADRDPAPPRSCSTPRGRARALHNSRMNPHSRCPLRRKDARPSRAGTEGSAGLCQR